MSAEEVVATRSFSKIADWIYEKTYNNETITEEEKTLLNKEINRATDVSIDIVNAKASRFMELDILHSNFKNMEGLEFWNVIYESALVMTTV